MGESWVNTQCLICRGLSEEGMQSQTETEGDKLVKKSNAEQVLPEGCEPISITVALIIFSIH